MSLVKRLQNINTIRKTFVAYTNFSTNNQVTNQPVELELLHYLGCGEIRDLDIIYDDLKAGNFRVENAEICVYIDGLPVLRDLRSTSNNNNYNNISLSLKYLNIGKPKYFNITKYNNTNIYTKTDQYDYALESRLIFDKSVRIVLRLWQTSNNYNGIFTAKTVSNRIVIESYTQGGIYE